MTSIQDDSLVVDNNDLSSLFGNIINKIPIKMSIFLFLIYMLLSSDIYMDFLESHDFINKNTRCLKNNTFIMNGIILVIFYIILDILIQAKVL